MTFETLKQGQDEADEGKEEQQLCVTTRKTFKQRMDGLSMSASVER